MPANDGFIILDGDKLWPLFYCLKRIVWSYRIVNKFIAIIAYKVRNRIILFREIFKRFLNKDI